MEESNELIMDESVDEEGDELDLTESSRRIHTRQVDAQVDGLYRKYKRRRLIVHPSFQRNFIWDAKKSSRLIESAILEIPIPTIYLSEEEDNKEYVIDGQQRLLSFFSFIDGTFPNGKDFRLVGLKVISDLNNKTYEELDEVSKEKIHDCKIRAITFISGSGSRLKFEVFERLNTGAVSLNHQELRNCIYHGKYMDLLREMSEDTDFRYLLGLSRADQRMRDIELVARFSAFYHFTHLKYKPPMSYFIDKDIDIYTKSFSEENSRDLKRAFRNSVAIIRSIFDKTAFNRYHMGGEKDHNNGWISKNFNSSLYDILMFSFSKINRNLVQPHLDSIRESLIDLMTNNDEFINSIDKYTSSANAVTTRSRIWEENLGRIIESTKQKRCFSYKLKKEFYDADPTCSLCNQHIRDIDDAALDHIQQYWLGGKTIPENARLTHRYCNWARSRNSEISYVPRDTARKLYKKISLRSDSYVCKASWQILFYTAEWLIKNDILRY